MEIRITKAERALGTDFIVGMVKLAAGIPGADKNETFESKMDAFNKGNITNQLALTYDRALIDVREEAETGDMIVKISPEVTKETLALMTEYSSLCIEVGIALYPVIRLGMRMTDRLMNGCANLANKLKRKKDKRLGNVHTIVFVGESLYAGQPIEKSTANRKAEIVAHRPHATDAIAVDPNNEVLVNIYGTPEGEMWFCVMEVLPAGENTFELHPLSEPFKSEDTITAMGAVGWLPTSTSIADIDFHIVRAAPKK